MSKFTPGPWRVCGQDRGGCSCHQIYCEDFPVATATNGEWGDQYPALRRAKGTRKLEAYTEKIPYGSIDPDTSKANARLIAAAPDMYATLEFIKDWFTRLEGGFPDDDPLKSSRERFHAPIHSAIDAALAKADGQA